MPNGSRDCQRILGSTNRLQLIGNRVRRVVSIRTQLFACKKYYLGGRFRAILLLWPGQGWQAFPRAWWICNIRWLYPRKGRSDVADLL